MGRMYVVPYENYYKGGVIDCLRRNYQWMREADREDVEKWVTPIISYTWGENPSNPYLYGAVLLDNAAVVGYVGCIYSNRNESDKKYKYLSCTTWCIDEGYRIYLAKLLKEPFSYADVITDFTPRKSVEAFLINVFHFQYSNKESIRFFPVPINQNEYKLVFQHIENFNDINDEILRMEYKDNSSFGVKCLRFFDEDNEGYVFYKNMDYNGKWQLIAKIMNPEFFSDNAHEITWEIQRKENFSDFESTEDCLRKIMFSLYDKKWIAMECESNFVNEKKINHPCYKYHNVTRLIWRKNESMTIKNSDLLYSEMVMLDLR